jgi:hypothetical protein
MHLDALGHLRDHPGILGQQIVARHAGGAREPRGHDHHIRPGDRRVVGGADHVAVEPVDGAGLHDVERLARRHPGEHVEHHDVAEFLEADQMGERPADVAGADEGDLVACHEVLPESGSGGEDRGAAPSADRTRHQGRTKDGRAARRAPGLPEGPSP